VHAFLRAIEDALIAALAQLGLSARRIEGKTGVFLAELRSGERARKIASIGIGVRRWITYHGFALNVSLDLDGFDVIVPCGLRDVEMTSVRRELERRGVTLPPDLDARARAAVEDAMRARLSPAPLVV